MSERSTSRRRKSSGATPSIEQPLSKSLNAELTEHDRIEIRARLEVFEKAINLLRAQCLSQLSDDANPESVLGLWAKQRHYQELMLELKLLARAI